MLNVNRKKVLPSLAKRLPQAAALTATLMAPTASTTSMGTTSKARKAPTNWWAQIKETPPKLAWVSMVCTRMSSLQNLTAGTPKQMDRFLKRRGQDLRRCDDVVTWRDKVTENDGDYTWEWPATATAGWKSKTDPTSSTSLSSSWTAGLLDPD